MDGTSAITVIAAGHELDQLSDLATAIEWPARIKVVRSTRDLNIAFALVDHQPPAVLCVFTAPRLGPVDPSTRSETGLSIGDDRALDLQTVIRGGDDTDAARKAAARHARQRYRRALRRTAGRSRGDRADRASRRKKPLRSSSHRDELTHASLTLIRKVAQRHPDVGIVAIVPDETHGRAATAAGAHLTVCEAPQVNCAETPSGVVKVTVSAYDLSGAQAAVIRVANQRTRPKRRRPGVEPLPLAPKRTLNMDAWAAHGSITAWAQHIETSQYKRDLQAIRRHYGLMGAKNWRQTATGLAFASGEIEVVPGWYADQSHAEWLHDLTQSIDRYPEWWRQFFDHHVGRRDSNARLEPSAHGAALPCPYSQSSN